MGSQQVVIVGGGVIGLCAAWQVMAQGMRVRLLEREPVGGDNCSLGNAGMIVPSHFIPLAAPGMLAKGIRWMFNRESPFYVRPRPSLDLARWGWHFMRHANARHVEASAELLRDLSLESRRMFSDFAAEQDFGLVRNGLLMLCKTRKGLDEESAVAEHARRLGLEARVLDAEQTAALDPDLTTNVLGAIHYPQDCHLDPARFIAALRKRVLEMGAEIENEVEIDAIRTANRRVTAVHAGKTSYKGDFFLIAGGSWTSRLLRQVGIRLPLQAGKGYSLTLPEPPQLPKLCSILTEAKIAVTPMHGALRVAGTMEIGGLNHRIDPLRVRGIVKGVVDYFPKFRAADFDGLQPWVGLRPVSPDGLPYLGPIPELPNLIVATGHAMMGLSLAPVTGKIVAETISRTSQPAPRPTSGDLRLAPLRFGR